jgi:hypothetical protein
MAYRLNRSRLQSLVELNSLEEVLDNLQEPFYSLLSEAENTFIVSSQKVWVNVQQTCQVFSTEAKVFAYHHSPLL